MQRNLELIAASPYSRFPVYSRDRSHVLGIVHAGDLFEQAVRTAAMGNIDIGAVVKPAPYVPATVSGIGLLEQFREHCAELALVVDEHGQIAGTVTLADLMADLMGARLGGVPGVEAHEDDAVQREDGSWLMDGAMPRELLGTAVPSPNEAAGAYPTLAGFVMQQLGHIPAAAEHVDWDGHRFEVVDMDRNRIDRVLVSSH